MICRKGEVARTPIAINKQTYRSRGVPDKVTTVRPPRTIRDQPFATRFSVLGNGVMALMVKSRSSVGNDIFTNPGNHVELRYQPI
jgi:hypothetical protein